MREWRGQGQGRGGEDPKGGGGGRAVLFQDALLPLLEAAQPLLLVEVLQKLRLLLDGQGHERRSSWEREEREGVRKGKINSSHCP